MRYHKYTDIIIGRLQALDIKVNNKEIKIMYIYGPNKDNSVFFDNNNNMMFGHWFPPHVFRSSELGTGSQFENCCCCCVRGFTSHQKLRSYGDGSLTMLTHWHFIICAFVKLFLFSQSFLLVLSLIVAIYMF